VELIDAPANERFVADEGREVPRVAWKVFGQIEVQHVGRRIPGGSARVDLDDLGEEGAAGETERATDHAPHAIGTHNGSRVELTPRRLERYTAPVRRDRYDAGPFEDADAPCPRMIGEPRVEFAAPNDAADDRASRRTCSKLSSVRRDGEAAHRNRRDMDAQVDRFEQPIGAPADCTRADLVPRIRFFFHDHDAVAETRSAGDEKQCRGHAGRASSDDRDVEAHEP
jgi:hypothetical protein